MRKLPVFLLVMVGVLFSNALLAQTVPSSGSVNVMTPPPSGGGSSFNRKLIGGFRFRGAREIVANLTLSASGRFDYALTYGAVDAFVRGNWVVDNNKVVLLADELPGPSFAWVPAQEEFEQNCSKDYADPGKPVSLVVCVLTPATKMPWRNIMITGVFSNGQRRSGETGSNGKLGFLARPNDLEWKDATVQQLFIGYRRGGVPQDSVTFSVPAGAKVAVIGFEPGNLVQQFFERMELRISNVGGDQVNELIVLQVGGDEEVGVFVRQ